MTRTFFAVQFAILSLLVAAAAAQPSELPDDVRRCYPLTVRQAADWSTLEEQILADEVVGSQTHPGRKARWIKVRYFSHEWIDGPWHATTRIVMPASHKEIRPGLAVICPAGVATRGREPGFTVEQDFMERTAMEFGVPVANMPSQGTHFGKSEIHQMSDELASRFVKRGNEWVGCIPLRVAFR